MDETIDWIFLKCLAQKGEERDLIPYFEGEDVALEEKKTVASEEKAAATPLTKHTEEHMR